VQIVDLCDFFQDTVYPERALSDKFNLVLQVARQVQVRMFIIVVRLLSLVIDWAVHAIELFI